MMKAAVYESYGPPEVLKIADVEPPSLRDDDRVLIRVHAASVNPGDYWLRKGIIIGRFMTGLTKPKQPILGMDCAGTIEAVGSNVHGFKAGDRVFGGCRGGHAEFASAHQNSICLMPEGATFQEAAAIPVAGLTALQGLRDVAQVKPGQQVLIYGASGGIGHFAVQLAKLFGAEVTAVCSTSNLPWVKALGADSVIDYTKEDFADRGTKYDLILDTVGKRTFFNCKRALQDTGMYITENIMLPWYHPVQLALSSLSRPKQFRNHLARVRHSDLDFLRELVEAGKVRPVVEKCYPLDQIVAAHRHVQGGHTKGKVVVQVSAS